MEHGDRFLAASRRKGEVLAISGDDAESAGLADQRALRRMRLWVVILTFRGHEVAVQGLAKARKAQRKQQANSQKRCFHVCESPEAILGSIR